MLDNALNGVCLQRLIISANDVHIVDRMFANCPNLQQLVFLSGPPAEYDELLFGSACTPTIYYMRENRVLWAPNGETTWEGLPLIEISSLKELPNIPLEIHGPLDRLEAFGWVETYDPTQKWCKLTVASDQGWTDRCRAANFSMGAPDEIDLLEGVTAFAQMGNSTRDVSARIAKLPASLQRFMLTAKDRIEDIEISSSNPYYHMEGDKLIETATGAVVWEEAQEETATAANPLETSTQNPTPQPIEQKR